MKEKPNPPVHLGKDYFEYFVVTKKRGAKDPQLILPYVRKSSFRVKARSHEEAMKVARPIAKRRGETVITCGLTEKSAARMFWWVRGR
jgi:hypothetical protein